MHSSNETLIPPQILADAYLTRARGLEGNAILPVVGYFLRFMDSNPQLPGAWLGLRLQLRKLLEIETRLSAERSIYVYDAPHTDLQLLANELSLEIEKWTQGESLLLPGGWRNRLTAGHAMLIRIEHQEQALLVSFINTGGGLDYHLKNLEPQKDLFQNIVRYKIPLDRLSIPELSGFLNKLLSMMVPTIHGKEISPKIYYEEIIPYIHLINGELILEDIQQRHFLTSGQGSGTCCQRVLHQLLKICLADMEEYRPLMIAFNLYALRDYFTFKDLKLNHPQTHYLLTVSLRHVLRLLHAQDTHLEVEQKVKLYAETRQYLDVLKGHPPETPSSQRYHPNRFEVSRAYQLSKVNLPPWPLPSALQDQSPLSLPPMLEFHEKQPVLVQLKALLLQCEKLNPVSLFLQLEHFILNCPLKLKLVKADFQDFYQQMHTITELYLQSYQQILNGPRLSARLAIALFSLQTIVHQLDPLAPAIKNKPHHDLFVLLHSLHLYYGREAYFATYSPKLDARLESIRALYRENPLEFPNTEVDDFSLFEYLLERTPALKTQLATLYERDFADPPKSHHGYLENNKIEVFYLVNFTDRLPQNSQFKALLNDIKRQRLLESIYVMARAALVGGFNPPTDQSRKFYTSEDYTDILMLTPSIGEIKDIALFLTASGKNKFHFDPNSIVQGMLTINHRHSKQLVRADNEVQIDPAQEGYPLKILTAEKIELREFAHLRRCLSAQILLTLDYFIKHSRKLNRRDMFSYLEANLFQPGLLFSLLKSSQGLLFLKRFEAFIASGLREYASRDHLNAESLSFIRLAYLVYQYAHQLSLPVHNHFQILNQQMNRLIPISGNSKLRIVLYRYQFLILFHLHHQKETINQEILLAYFNCQIKSVLTDSSPEEELHFTEVQCSFQQKLRVQQPLIYSYLPTILKHFGFSAFIPELEKNLRYPFIHFKVKGDEMSIDLEHAHIFINGFYNDPSNLDHRIFKI